MAVYNWLLTRYRWDLRRIVPQLYLPVLIAGALLRLAGLGAAAFWFDEAYSLMLIRQPLLELVRIASLDFTPPLGELIAYPFVRVLGETEIAYRLPALLASWVSLFLAWRLIVYFIPAEKQAARLGAVVLVSLLPYQLWMAQDGRVYSIFTALYLGALCFALHRWYLAMAACCGLMLYAHGIAPVFVAAILGIAWFNAPRELRRIGIAGGLAGLAFLPWMPAYLSIAGSPFWSQPLTLNGLLLALSQAFFALTLPSLFLELLAGLLPGVCIFLAAVFSLEPWTAKDWKNPLIVLAIAAIGPLALMVLASIVTTNVVLYRTLSPLVSLLAIWFAATLTPRRLTWTTWLIPYTWIVLLIIGLASWSPAIRGGELRDQAQSIRGQLRPGDVIYHATGSSLLPVQLYAPWPGTYLLDQGPDIAVRGEILDAYQVARGSLDDIPHSRAWIFWARDPLLSKPANERMQTYTQDATLITTIHYWQTSPIEIYLKGE